MSDSSDRPRRPQACGPYAGIVPGVAQRRPWNIRSRFVVSLACIWISTLSVAARAQVTRAAGASIRADRPSPVTVPATPAPVNTPTTPLPYQLEEVAAWGGPVNTFVRDGDLGYMGSGQRLLILDMSDLSNLVELGAVRLGSAVRDIKVRDGYAYVVTNTVVSGSTIIPPDAGLALSGFHVVDVREPGSPELVWSNDPSATGFFSGREIELYNDIAILRGNSSLLVADVSNQTAPVVLDMCLESASRPCLSASSISDMTVQGDRLYVGTAGNVGSLVAYDLVDADVGAESISLTPIGTLFFSAVQLVRHVTVNEDWIYVAVSDRSPIAPPREVIWAIDATNPSAMTKVGSFDSFTHPNPSSPRPISDISASGGFLYVADGGTISADVGNWDAASGLVVLDIATNPGSPTEVARYRTHGTLVGVEGDDSIAYLRDWGEGLIVLDVTNPLLPVRLGNVHSPAVLRYAIRTGDLLLISDLWNGFSILDVSDPSTPTLVGVHQAARRVGIDHHGLAVDTDGVVYLAAGRAGLEAVDISNPATPMLLGAIRLPDVNWSTGAVTIESGDRAQRVADGIAYRTYRGKIAYLAVRTLTGNFIFSLDVTDPAMINQLDPDAVNVSRLPLKMKRSRQQGVLYGAGEGGVVTAIGSTLPANLQASSLLGSPGGTVDIAYDTSKEILYATSARNNGRLHVLNLVDKLTAVPSSVTNLRSPGATALHPSGLVVLSAADQLLGKTLNRALLFDIADSSNPSVVGTVVLPYPVSGGGDIRYGDVWSDATGIYVTSGMLGNQEQNSGLSVLRVQSSLDRDGNGIINANDIFAFVRDIRSKNSRADLNFDRRVDESDLEVFLHLYNQALNN